jgi:hypothetical protein
VTSIEAAELQGPDPDRLGRRWSEILQLPLGTNAAGAPELALENAGLRFVEARDGRGEGLGGIDLAAVDPERALRSAEARGVPAKDDQILVCGTRVRLVGASR